MHKFYVWQRFLQTEQTCFTFQLFENAEDLLLFFARPVWPRLNAFGLEEVTQSCLKKKYEDKTIID